jgi:2-desacetyl-2-hydroxyethyl bacteriochlorophyllide A dehydrogenase
VISRARVVPGSVRILSVEGVCELPPGHARIAVSACGLCGTDLHLFHGMRLPPGVRYPVHPGHEVAGTVVELGPDTAKGLPVGTPVVLHPLAECGACESCRAGRPDDCPGGEVLGLHRPGGLAEEVVWPVSRMVAVPGVDPRQAAILADAVATAKRALDKARVPVGGALCVLGAGGVGTHVMELARLADPTVHLMGVVRSQGSADRLRAAGFDSVVAGADLRPHGPFDAVIDFSGDPAAPTLGTRLLCPGGTLVFGSVLDGDLALASAQRVQVRELVIAGVYSSSMDDLRAVAELAVSGALDLSASVTHTFSLSASAEAFATLSARPPGMVRVVVTVP